MPDLPSKPSSLAVLKTIQGIPQSDALLAAAPDSLSELFSRAPADLSEADKLRMVEAFREQRARLAQAEASGGGARSIAKSQAKLTTSTQLSLDDMGL